MPPGGPGKTRAACPSKPSSSCRALCSKARRVRCPRSARWKCVRAPAWLRPLVRTAGRTAPGPVRPATRPAPIAVWTAPTARGGCVRSAVFSSAASAMPRYAPIAASGAACAVLQYAPLMPLSALSARQSSAGAAFRPAPDARRPCARSTKYGAISARRAKRPKRPPRPQPLYGHPRRRYGQR